MLRENHTFYMQTTDGEYIQFKRPLKASEQIKEYKSQISYIRAQIKCAQKNGTATPAKINQLNKEIARFETRIDNLERQNPSHKRLHHHYTKMKHDVLKMELRKKLDIAHGKGWHYVDAETLAYELNVKPVYVHQIFQEFNVEGILSQPIHNPPHDNKRCFYGGGLEGWCGDFYFLRIGCKEND